MWSVMAYPKRYGMVPLPPATVWEKIAAARRRRPVLRRMQTVPRPLLDKAWIVLVAAPLVAGVVSVWLTAARYGWQPTQWIPLIVAGVAGVVGVGVKAVVLRLRGLTARHPWWWTLLTPLVCWIGLLGIVVWSTAPLSPWYWLTLIGYAGARLVTLRLQPTPSPVVRRHKGRHKVVAPNVPGGLWARLARWWRPCSTSGSGAVAC